MGYDCRSTDTLQRLQKLALFPLEEFPEASSPLKRSRAIEEFRSREANFISTKKCVNNRNIVDDKVVYGKFVVLGYSEYRQSAAQSDEYVPIGIANESFSMKRRY